MEEQLQWRNLLENKCPKCGKDFVGSSKKIQLKNGEPAIEHLACGFQISERRYAQICSGQVTQDLAERDNIYG